MFVPWLCCLLLGITTALAIPHVSVNIYHRPRPLYKRWQQALNELRLNNPEQPDESDPSGRYQLYGLQPVKMVCTCQPLLPAPQSIHDLQPCKRGWTEFGTSCYLHSKEEVPRDVASAHCRVRGAFLTSILSSEEDDFLRSLLPDVPFKGQFWTGLKLKNGVWKWDDGSPITYTNWYPGYPDGDPATHRCMKANYIHGTWDDYLCSASSLIGFICKYDRLRHMMPIVQPIPPPPLQTTDVCPMGWTKFEPTKSCYLQVFAPRRHFDAEDDCLSKGAHISSVTSGQEQAFLTQLMDRQRFHVGLRQNFPGGFNYQRLDGGPPVFFSWARNEPDHHLGSYPYCVTLWPNAYGGMYMVDDGCTYIPPLPYVCKRPL